MTAMTTQAAPMGQPDPQEPRIDAQGRLMCHAKRRGTGELCRAPAMRGQRVCRVHGGAAPAAKQKASLRLAALVEPAIATLAREMTQADKSADKQRAANSILDRAGIGRVQRVDTADAREMLLARLLELREQGYEAEERALNELEEGSMLTLPAAELDPDDDPDDDDLDD